MFCHINIFILLFLISLYRCQINPRYNHKSRVPFVIQLDEEVKSNERQALVGINFFKDNNQSDKLNDHQKLAQDNCWAGLKTDQLFDTMDTLDKKYYEHRLGFSATMKNENFNKDMLKVLVKNKGKAQRDIQKNNGKANHIPAGLNLGGRCPIMLNNSILILHRMKLCNSTNFKIDWLQSSVINMTLNARLSLNDLVLEGTYERDMIKKAPYELYYRPTFNEIQLALKNVKYEVEGRYRILGDRLTLELLISKLIPGEISLKYKNGNEIEVVTEQQIELYLNRLRVELDTWLKNYLNDYHTYKPLSNCLIGDGKEPSKLQEFESTKAMFLNLYMESALVTIQNKINEIKANAVKAPTIAIIAVNGLKLELSNGVLRGLDGMFRRSVATGRQDGDGYRVDGIVGFNKLKLEYTYELRMSGQTEPQKGLVVMIVDELSALLSLQLSKKPEAFKMKFSFLKTIKPEKLLIQDAATVRSNFKYLFDNHVSAIMSNIIIDYVNRLSDLPKCDPKLPEYNPQKDE